jgi:hypothetical protein
MKTCCATFEAGASTKRLAYNYYSVKKVIRYVSFPPRAEFIPTQAGAGAGWRESTRSRNAGYPLEFTLAQAGTGMTPNTNKLS